MTSLSIAHPHPCTCSISSALNRIFKQFNWRYSHNMPLGKIAPLLWVLFIREQQTEENNFFFREFISCLIFVLTGEIAQKAWIQCLPVFLWTAASLPGIRHSAASSRRYGKTMRSWLRTQVLCRRNARRQAAQEVCFQVHSSIVVRGIQNVDRERWKMILFNCSRHSSETLIVLILVYTGTLFDWLFGRLCMHRVNKASSRRWRWAKSSWWVPTSCTWRRLLIRNSITTAKRSLSMSTYRTIRTKASRKWKYLVSEVCLIIPTEMKYIFRMFMTYF